MSEQDLPSTLYDDVFYPTAAHQSASPERLYTMGTIFGTNPAALEGASVLEIGCGDASHLLPFAALYPQARCTGLDYAPLNIRLATENAERHGIENCTVVCKDLLDIHEPLGSFDYIISHGLYAWVPPEVREALLRVVKQNLAPRGIAFISYNTKPGGYVREMIRDIMLYHSQQFATPEEKVREARAIMYFLAKANQNTPHIWRSILNEELKRLSQLPDNALFHDDLSPVYSPFSFTEFMDAALAKGLMYLAEADFVEMQTNLPPEFGGVIERLAKGNILVKEQYLDYLRYRRFRQTLLVHAELPIRRSVDGSGMEQFVSSSAASVHEEKTAESGEKLTIFKTPRGVGMQTANPLTDAALRFLGEEYPKAYTATQIVEEAYRRLGRDEVSQNKAEDIQAWLETMVRSYGADMLEIYASNRGVIHHIEDTPDARPKVWEYARKQAEYQSYLTTLRYSTFEVEKDSTLFVISLCNGEHGIDDIAALLAQSVERGETQLSTDDIENDIRQVVMNALRSLASHALLVQT